MVDLEAEVETVLKERKKRNWRLIEGESDARRGGVKLVAL